MKKFSEWLKVRTENMTPAPNMGQAAAAPVQQQAQPQRVSLGDLGKQVTDPNWHHLYDAYARMYQRHPQDQQVQQLGVALYQAAQSKNMQGLQPFAQKYLHAQPIR